MLMVLMFLVITVSLMTLAYRQLGVVLRAESIRLKQQQRDEGTLQAAAAALALLETGTPPSDPYVCGTTIVTAIGSKAFTITFASQGTGVWQVQSAPTAAGESPIAMPSTFAPQSGGGGS